MYFSREGGRELGSSLSPLGTKLLIQSCPPSPAPWACLLSQSAFRDSETGPGRRMAMCRDLGTEEVAPRTLKEGDVTVC